MTFPTPPGLRVPYDLDGSVGFIRLTTNNALYELTSQDLRYLNSENTPGLVIDNEANSASATSFSIILPVALRLRGIFFAGVAGEMSSTLAHASWSATIETSENSTNSVDGEWFTIGTRSDNHMERILSSSPTWRRQTQSLTGGVVAYPDNNIIHRSLATGDVGTGIHALNGPGTRNVRAVRVSVKPFLSIYRGERTLRIHLYGEPDTNARTDRLQIWRSDVDLPVGPADVDWGDSPVSTTADKSFRLKNVSTVFSANDVSVHAASQSVPLTSPVPAPESFFLFSLDGGLSWKTTLDISTLSPGSLSPVIRVRRTVPQEATLSTWSPRIVAVVGSWT